jgi:uncharacterized membrane protein YkoI
MFRRVLLSLLAAALLAGPAVAQRGSWAPEGRQEERQREVPFSQIQRELRSRYGGQMLDAQKRGDTYVVQWITEDGRRLVIEVDAQSGRILSTRG